MARGGGSTRAGSVYHVISRFVAQEWFIDSDIARRTYRTFLGLAMEKTDWRCLSYAIMSNHIHLGLIAGLGRLADWMRPMHSMFAQWINERRERIGGVFVKGPNVIEMRRDGTARLINYIHANPVRAGVVDRASDSDWTSHREYVGLASPPSWLHVERGLELSGFPVQGFRMWSEATNVERADVDAARVVPATRRGRPRRDVLRLAELATSETAGAAMGLLRSHRSVDVGSAAHTAL